MPQKKRNACVLQRGVREGSTGMPLKAEQQLVGPRSFFASDVLDRLKRADWSLLAAADGALSFFLPHALQPIASALWQSRAGRL